MMVSIYQPPREWIRPHVHCSIHPDMNEALKPTGSLLPEVIPSFCIMKRLGVFLLPLDGMLFPRNLLGFPNNLPLPIYTPGWRETL